MHVAYGMHFTSIARAFKWYVVLCFFMKKVMKLQTRAGY